VIKDNKLVGGVLYGDTADGPWYFQLLRDGQDIHEIRDHLLFGQSHVGDVGHQGHSKAAAMADSAEVCGCNGVSKGSIVKAIKEKGLFTLDDIKKHTKAASSCGSCAGLCEQILRRPSAAPTRRRRRTARPSAGVPTTRIRRCATRSARSTC
jgi:nitrite reductase (NADH) large subunit